MTKYMRASAGLVALATLLAGCATSQQARDVLQSGFLGPDYDLLRPGTAPGGMTMRRHE